MSREGSVFADVAPTDIAIVGMAARVPGARTVAEFWRNLCAGVESIVRYSDEQLLRAGEDPDVLRDTRYVKAGAPMFDLEMFDAGFFGFNAREAAILDPQHRHFLEVCWEALEDSGHVPESFRGAIGVFGGSGMQSYFAYHLAPNRKLMQDVGEFLVRHTGNDKDFLTTRVSYCLNLTGPSVAVQTACSTSLVSVHLAVQSLLNRECDLALAGGVTIQLPHGVGYVFHEGEVSSPDGHCRAFDGKAGGTLFGSGAGVVVLRRAQDALDDGDTIYALIRGSAINNDGGVKAGYFAPSVDGQAQCVAEALAVAGVPPESVDYVEAHGTGTPVGDPIEIAALKQAFGGEHVAVPFSGIGSVKTNIGHLDAAAGVASLIKVALALKHRKVPASLNFASPNPECAFEGSPFYVNAALREWDRRGAPRRAGVNCLGVGGTNAHVVLEEAPELPVVPDLREAHLLCLSARSPAALDSSTGRLVEFLRQHPRVSLADVAFTLQVGRRGFKHRRVIASTTVEDAVKVLTAGPTPRVVSQEASDAARPIVFMFPGGGAQYPNMGRALYRTEPLFRECVDEVLTIVEASTGRRLAASLFPPPGAEAQAAAELETASATMLSTFVIEYALARLWMSLGVEPAAMIGHSLGEITAACVAGVLEVPDAITLLAARGRLLDRLPPGATLVVALSEAELIPRLESQLSIAAVNAPAVCVVSGPTASIERLEATLAEAGVECRRLRLSFAAHTAMLDGSLDGFARDIDSIRLRPPARPVMSSETGRWMDAGDAADVTYWVRHLRNPVRFADGLSAVLREMPSCVLLEVGPGTTLASLARQHREAAAQTIVSSLPHHADKTGEAEYFLRAVGSLWAAGQRIDWAQHHTGERRCRIPLPTYPFEHQRHWIDRPSTVAAQLTTGTVARVDPLAKLPSIDDWFARPAWRLTEPPPVSAAVETWLVFDAEEPVHAAVRNGLAVSGEPVVRVLCGNAYHARADGHYVIRPWDRADYDRLLGDLTARGIRPSRVVHLWGLKPADASPDPLEVAVDASFYSVLFFAQAWGEAEIAHPLHLAVVSSGMQRVAHEPVPHPERALALGPCLVVPKELDTLTCSSIDWAFRDRRDPSDATADLVHELRAQPTDPIVALRESGRWVQSYEKVDLAKSGSTDGTIRVGGVYLITGGLGSLGLTIAEELGTRFRARLALVSRRRFPAQPEWTDWLDRHPASDETSTAIRALQRVVDAGGAVEVLQADVTNTREVEAVVDAVLRRFGTVDGILHAAGVLDDGPMQVKSRAAADAVLGAKVHGTLALERAVRDLPLDFILLCSSASTVLAPIGQVDYVAANAFLNAYALSRDSASRRTRAILWGSWAERGMAFRAAQAVPLSRTDAFSHPLLGELERSATAERAFHARYDPAGMWVLGEHRLANGTPVLPGSGFIELFRAAFSIDGRFTPVELKDVHLLAPLEATPGRPCDVRVTVVENGGSSDARVESRIDGRWREHARATGAPDVSYGAVTTIPLDAIRGRCRPHDLQRESGAAVVPQEEHLRLGPRWKSVRALHVGGTEALALCELPPNFAGDLDTWLAHPALIDLALHAGLPLAGRGAATDDLFVPLSFDRIRIAKPIPAKVFSHARLTSLAQALPNVVTFDVTIADEHGEILVEVEHLVLRRLDAQARAEWTAAPPAASAPPTGQRLLGDLVAHGIRPAEGVEVFHRALGASAPACVVASSVDLVNVLAAMRTGSQAAARRTQPGHVPAVVKAPPRDDYERTLCQLWSEFLGVDPIGIHDDFFELGGHSLIAVRLFTRIKKIYRVSFGLAVLFEAPTIATCAALIREQIGTRPAPGMPSESGPTAVDELPRDVIRRSPCLVGIQPKGSRPPFFLLPGVGGNVLLLQGLVKHLDADQPVIGLQSLGVAGDHTPLNTMEDIAARFIAEMKSIQPKGPYRLGGYSWGGFAGFEIARQLWASGDRVDLLALLDTLLEVTTPVAPRSWGSSWWGRIGHHSHAVLTGSEGDRIAYVREMMNRLKRRMSVRKAQEAFRPVKVANQAALDGYRLETYSGTVTMLHATDRRWAGPGDTLERWRTLAEGGLIVRPVPGDHFSIFEDPNVRVLARELNEALRQAGTTDELERRSQAHSPAAVPTLAVPQLGDC